MLPEWATCEGGPRDQYDTMELQALPDEWDYSERLSDKTKTRREQRSQVRRSGSSQTGQTDKSLDKQSDNSGDTPNAAQMATENETCVPTSASLLMDIDLSDIKTGVGEGGSVVKPTDSADKAVAYGEVSAPATGISRISQWTSNKGGGATSTSSFVNTAVDNTSATSTVATSDAEQCAQIQKIIMKKINNSNTMQQQESSRLIDPPSTTSSGTSNNSGGSQLLMNILQKHSSSSYSGSSRVQLASSEASSSHMDTKTMEANLRDLLLPADRDGTSSSGVRASTTSTTNAALHQKLGLSRAATVNGQVRTLEEIESSYLKQQQTPQSSHNQLFQQLLLNGDEKPSKLMSLQIPAQSQQHSHSQKAAVITTPISPQQNTVTTQPQQPSPQLQPKQRLTLPQQQPQQPQLPMDQQLQRFLMMHMAAANATTNPSMMLAMAAQRMAVAGQQGNVPTAHAGQSATNAAAAAFALGLQQNATGFQGGVTPGTAQFFSHGGAAASPTVS